MIALESAPLKGARPSQPLAVFALDGVDLSLHPHLGSQTRAAAEAAKGEHAKGKLGEVVPVTVGGRRILVVGVGKKAELTAETLRKAAGGLARFARKRWETVAVALPETGPVTGADAALAVAEGLALGSYEYTRYKKVEKDDKPVLKKAVVLAPASDARAAAAAVQKAVVRTDAVAWVRDLVNDGPSDKSPERMAAHARSIAGGSVKVQVMGRKDLERLKMNAILGVARGGSVHPTFVHLTYKPKGKARKKIALVGKGITFDSGGLSIKPAASMETMKMDMAGAATVLAVIRALKTLQLPVEVHGFTPFSYNLPGSDALKPGDILRAYNGKTIEVLNTDAEGRLVLSDALAYASKMKFDAIVDLATLTGAALVALGAQVTAAMVNDRDLWDLLKTAAEKSGEKLWELPLVEEYKDQIKSKVADLQNIGSVRGEGGTIIGGLFLQEFVDGTPWAHLDIAGPAWADRGGPYTTLGGTGNPVRTILNYLESL